MFYGFDIYYFILIVPTLILALWAQSRVSSTYKKYGRVYNKRGYTGYDVARKILDANGLNGVSIEHVSGDLTDHFDPKTNVVRLSDSTYNSQSVGAIGVAAHEVGHAIQYSLAYAPIKIRNSIFPLVNIANYAAIPIAILGFVIGALNLVYFGIILFSAVVLFQFITLPVEFNASRRAVKIIDEYGILNEEELKGTKKVLSAAALTYVAAAAVSVANLLRLVLLARDRR